MFSAPPRSETKNSDAPSALHIGHRSLAPPVVSAAPRGRRIGRRQVAQPDLRFVEMAVAVPPPLAGRVAARRHREHLAVGRGRGEELVRVAVAADRHRRAARRPARDRRRSCRPRDRARSRRSTGHLPSRDQPSSCSIPSSNVIAPHVARREGQHVDIAAAGARRDERELRLVRRVHRSRVVGGVGDEQARVAAGSRHRPDVAARDERDLAAIGRDRRARQTRPAAPARARAPAPELRPRNSGSVNRRDMGVV